MLLISFFANFKVLFTFSVLPSIGSYAYYVKACFFIEIPYTGMVALSTGACTIKTLLVRNVRIV
jgi:hypothetical protein